jgi:hypothetical protein
LAAKRSHTLEWDPQHLRAAIDAAGVGLWWWNVETDEIQGCSTLCGSGSESSLPQVGGERRRPADGRIPRSANL